MKLLLLVFVLLADTPKIETKYVCSGTTSDGTYKAELRIEQKGTNYFLLWVNTPNQGMGFRHGNTLSVAFVDTRVGAVGVINYDVQPGKLVGQWTGGNGVYTETCSLDVTNV
jgi:hypothetical protein